MGLRAGRTQVNSRRRRGPDSPIIGTVAIPQNKPKAVVGGIVARAYDQAVGPLAALATGVVVDFYWSEAMPTSSGLDPTWVAMISAQLNDCNAKGRKVIIRPRLGFYAPEWVKAHPSVGRLKWYTNHGLPSTDPNNIGGPAPSNPAGPYKEYLPGTAKWWSPTYQSMVDSFYSLLAAQFASHPAVAEVDVAYTSTQFMEPINKQSGCEENVKVMMDGGWTEAIDDAIFERSWRTFMASQWAANRVACFTSYNPTGKYVPDATKLSGFKFAPGKNMPRVIALMEKQIAVCGGLAILANESLVNPWQTASGSDGGQMYARMVAAHTNTAQQTLLAFQSETLVKINSKYATLGSNVQGTINDAIAMGSHRVEIPIGCQNFDANYPLSYISPSFAATASAQLKANANGLIAP